MKPFQTRIKGRLTSTGESHHRNPRWIDPRMFREKFQSPVRVNRRREATQLILIGDSAYDATRGKAVDYECRDAKGIELLGPVVVGSRDSAGTMNKNYRRQAIRSGSRNAKFAC
jgi:hypothetical protein